MVIVLLETSERKNVLNSMQFEFFQYICIEIETYIPVQAQIHDLDWNKKNMLVWGFIGF